MNGPTKSLWTRTIIVLFVLVFLGFGSTCGVLSYIMIAKADEYRTLAEEQQLRDTVTQAQRGNIYDSNMNVLATSATAWQTYVTPSSIEKNDQEAIAKGLSELLELDYEKVLGIVQKSTGYETVGSSLDADKAAEVRTFISENEFGSVIGLDETSERYYPNNNLASTVLGFVGSDNQGLSGLEYYYDTALTGTPGRVIAAKNAKGASLPFSYEKVVDSEAGNSLVLTVDEYIQYVVEKNLDKAILENTVTNRGCCIVMNVNTGEVLAMATKPDFDPNAPFTIYDENAATVIAALEGDEKSAAVLKAQQEQWRNKCVSDVYEPGSVFKIITASAALEEGALKTTDTFYCPGYIIIANERISCHKHAGHGSETLEQAFENSCNPAFITIGQKLGVTLFTKYRKSFGLENLTGIDLPGESGSIVHATSSMASVELASESFGQTFKISPIQLITAISAAVNGGYLYEPHVVKQIIDEDGNIVQSNESTLVRQVVSAETSSLICGYLEKVVSEGTGSNAYLAGYRVGGKTGTSQKIDTQDENGEITRYIASFGAIAPSDKPEIAVLMLLDEPQVENPYGGTCVAPYVANMLEEILPYLGVTPVYTEEEAKELAINTPDVIGNSVSTAKNTLEGSGLSVKVIGEGDTVVSQVPASSATIPAGGTVVLYTDTGTERTTAKVPDFNGMTVSQANKAATNAGLNMIIAGSTTESTSYTQSVAAGTEVEIGTVIVVSFRENITVE